MSKKPVEICAMCSKPWEKHFKTEGVRVCPVNVNGKRAPKP